MLKGMALQQAMLDVKRTTPIYHWAGFGLFGFGG
jgi:hypothetical protein